MAFSYKASITVDHTKVPNTNQSAFPVLFSGTYDGTGGEPDLRTTGNGGKVQNANGYDIYFYSDAALTTRIPAEREVYTASTGVVVFWVKYDLLTASDVTFYIAYGDSSISSDPNSDGTYGATSVWDSNYKGVYHLPDGTTLTANDSTSNANNGTLNNSPAATTGKIDGAANFVGASSQYINGTGINIASTPFTISFWVKMVSGGADQTIFSIGSTGATRQAIHLRRTTDTAMLFGMWFDDLSSGVPNLTSWRHITVTLDSSFNQSLYADGSLQNSRTAGGYFTGNTTWNIGRFQSFGEYISGDVDEVRVSSVSRSADWITTEYNNQSATSTFYTVGSESPVGTVSKLFMLLGVGV